MAIARVPLILLAGGAGALLAASVWTASAPGVASGIEGVFSGSSSAHTCALSAEGGVECWGRNSYGQLGDGTTDDRAEPGKVAGLDGGVVTVAAGNEHTCALMTSGAVTCWGRNRAGQIGDGTTTSRTTPTSVAGLPGGATAIAAGFGHTCALTEGGAVMCWGNNLHGQLGIGTVDDEPRTMPQTVIGLEEGVAAIAAGDWHTCAVTDAGGLVCWGENLHGQVGNGLSGMNQSVPATASGLGSGVASVAAGRVHTCAVTNAGGVKCWGGNGDGQLGDGTTTRRTTPVNVTDLESPVAAVVAGSGHTCALATAGSVACWGSGNYGQLGHAQFADSATPVGVTGLSGVTAIAAGSEHTCAVAFNSEAMCWGRNAYGQLGDGTTKDSAVAVAVSGKQPPTPTPPLLPDSDGDTLPDDEELLAGTDPDRADTDADGCADGREVGLEPSTGGLRDPLNFWDFFDVPIPSATPPRDRAVSISDILAVVSRFGASGDPAVDPQSTPAETGYHPSYDRTPLGPNVWNLAQPNGTISIQDVILVVQQFGHSCR